MWVLIVIKQGSQVALLYASSPNLLGNVEVGCELAALCRVVHLCHPEAGVAVLLVRHWDVVQVSVQLGDLNKNVVALRCYYYCKLTRPTYEGITGQTVLYGEHVA